MQIGKGGTGQSAICRAAADGVEAARRGKPAK